MAKDLQVPLKEIPQAAAQLKQIDLTQYATEAVGEPTLRDILSELEKPGRDPRAQFTYAQFAAGINEISDLRPGMVLEGNVTNVANFGAFIDIGVHQDGLVHVSQMANHFVKDPKEVVQVGQVIKVQVLEIDEKLKRISLTMKLESAQSNMRSGNQLIDAKQATLKKAPSKPAKSAAGSSPPKRSRSFSQPAPKPPSASATSDTAQTARFDPELLKQRFNRRRP